MIEMKEIAKRISENRREKKGYACILTDLNTGEKVELPSMVSARFIIGCDRRKIEKAMKDVNSAIIDEYLLEVKSLF